MTLGRTLVGKTAVVVGASGGIGGAIAKELAKRGARLVLSGRNTDRLEQLCAQLTGGNHAVVQCDIRSAPSIDALARTSKDISSTQGSGGVSVLVNAAGISRDSLAVRLNDVEETLGTNLVGAMHLCKAFVPQMMRGARGSGGGGGSIINVSSVIGLHGNAGQSVYAASKAGLVGFTKSLAKEVASRGVCANVVAPGFIATEMTGAVVENRVTRQLVDRIPLKSPGSVDDVAHAVAFLAESKYITGQVRLKKWRILLCFERKRVDG
ncbi:hypothetical protein GGI23_000199 [Coemansia sp. RSA 2559]|nr:hypothetical protein GGI23_000199 [Coemansia sp. RSA 2559]KAJ2869655.1 hypothetical protein GGI22_000118 [Coemansia erecta]